MARRRMIDPNIWTSEDVGKLSFVERLLLIGMFSNADDYGKGKANPVFLRSTIFPYDDIPVSEIEDGLEHIEKNINIKIYTIDGSNYYKFTRWSKWQTVQKPQESVIPEPTEIVENDSGMILDSVENDSGLREEKEKRREEKGKEEKRKESDSLNLDNEAIELCKYYEQLKPGESISTQLPTLKIFLDMYGFEWTKEALQITVSNKNGFIKSYMEKILKNWKAEGHTEPIAKINAPPVKKNTFSNYGGQRKYDMKKLKAQLLGRETENNEEGDGINGS